METKPRIFISYAKEDQERVRDLYRKLMDKGFAPWLDQVNIIPGERWELAIRQAIRNSDFFIACLSANSVNKRGMIQKEIKDAIDVLQERLESDIYLIPVRLEECRVPEILNHFQWVDLFAEDGWTRLLKALSEGIERRANLISPKVSEWVRKNKQAMVKRMRGLIAQQRNDYDRAEQNLQEALAIWQEFGIDKEVATVLGDLGQLAHKRKKYDAAERFYHQSNELAKKINDKEVQTVCISYQGQLAIDRQKWSDAHKRCEQALALGRELGHVEVIAQTQHGLALVWEAEGRPDMALSLAQEALAIYERLQHRGLAETRELVQRLTAAVQKSGA